MVNRADRFQAMLDDEPGMTRVDLARRLGGSTQTTISTTTMNGPFPDEVPMKKVSPRVSEVLSTKVRSPDSASAP